MTNRQVSAVDGQLEQISWMFYSTVRRMVRAAEIHSRDIERLHGISVSQLQVLWVAAHHDHTPIGRLARETGVSGASLTGLVDRMEEQGLVERVRSADDKRRVLIETTEKGREVLANHPLPFDNRFVNALGQLESWRRTHLLSEMQHVADMMERHTGDSLGDHGDSDHPRTDES